MILINTRPDTDQICPETWYNPDPDVYVDVDLTGRPIWHRINIDTVWSTSTEEERRDTINITL